MIRLILTLMTIGILFNPSKGQSRLTGVVLDKQRHTGIPYVNIGIRGTNVGTAAFENGEFQIVIPDNHRKDSLTFSAIGYKSLSHAIANLPVNGNMMVALESEAVILKEIVITADRKSKPLRIGPSGNTGMGQQFASKEGGAAMAVLLNEQRKPVLLLNATVYIEKNELPEFKLRCRIMNVINGKPGEDILKENVIATSTIKKGMVQVDLTTYQMVMQDPFFLVFEWVLDKAVADYYKRMDMRPAWWPEGAQIHNRNTIVFLDDNKTIIKKTAMTKDQQREYEQLRLRQTEFSVRPTKNLKGFARVSSMSDWHVAERDVVCNVQVTPLQD